MITLPLNQKTKLACNCAQDKLGCPWCEGSPGALPSLNRGALEAALALIAQMGLTPVNRIETAYLPDPAMVRGLRVCTLPIAQQGGAYIAEGLSGEALLVLDDGTDTRHTNLTAERVKPGDALNGIARAYPAMDIPPIVLDM